MIAAKRIEHYPLLLLATVAVAAFLLGRVSVGIKGYKCAEAASSIVVPKEPLLLRTEGSSSISVIASPGDTSHPDKSDWERIARGTRLLEFKPPLPVGDGGSPSYIIQPYQVSVTTVYGVFVRG
jgi:hypothetical protein